MRKRKKENLRPVFSRLTPKEEAEFFDLRPSGSHGMTLNRPFGEDLSDEKLSLQTNIEYHLTVRVLNESLTRRDLSILLDVLNYQAVNFGINFTMSLAIWELYFRLLGNKSDPKQISDARIRLTLTVSDLILRKVRDRAFSLDPGRKLEFSEAERDSLSLGLMSKRTYGSRFMSWRPERLLEVRTVPVDIQFLERRIGSQPYISYCKGYGESHPNAHRHKTKISAELDGDGLDPQQVEDLSIFERCTNPVHVLSEYLLIRYYNEKEEN